MQPIADDAKVNAILDVLAGESSKSAIYESVDVFIGHVCGGDKRICSPGSACRKRTRRVGYSAVSTETKRRKRKLWRSSGLELEVDSTAPDLSDDPASVDLNDDIESCGGTRADRYVSEKEEEDVSSSVHRNHSSKASNDVLVQALSGLVSLQGMTISTIDHALEEIIPEDLLLELSEAEGAHICIEVPDGAPSTSFMAGKEITPPVCHASPTFKDDLIHENTLIPEGADEGYPAPEGVTEDNPAPEGAAEGDSAPEGATEDDPAPKGPKAGSSSAASMDVHVGSPLVQSEEVVVTSLDLPAVLAGSATLEVSNLGTKDPISVVGAEIPLGVTLGMNYNLPFAF
jgi:hypothetical protein